MKALVLASGGVDSTTCLGLAVNKYGKENVIALTVAYGQKHTKEIEAARKTAEYYGVEHLLVYGATFIGWRPPSQVVCIQMIGFPGRVSLLFWRSISA